jgi:phosphate transport system protein
VDGVVSGDPVEGHTLKAVDQALGDLRLRTVLLGALVIEQVSAAASALLAADRALAAKVLEREASVTAMARHIDHRAFECIALRQLVAGDLRLARAIARIVVDLEGAGEEGGQLARIGMRLHGADAAGAAAAPAAEPLLAATKSLRHMAELAGAMLRQALRALDESDLAMSRTVTLQELELDREFASAVRLLLTRVMEGRPAVGAIVDTVFAAKSLERIGDHASNIARQVQYFMVGDPAGADTAPPEMW